MKAATAGDSAKANVYYKWLGTANPYFDDGIIAAANYFSKKGNTSYNILAEARLYHPSSINIQKAYALESARQGFETYARNALTSFSQRSTQKNTQSLQNKLSLIFQPRHNSKLIFCNTVFNVFVNT